MTTYATVQHFRKAFDVRLIADLGGDGNTPGSATESNSIITTALNRASSEIRSYAMRGERYTEVNLDALYADEDWMLIGLCCDLAMGHVFSRRGGVMPPDIKDKVTGAQAMLEALKDGANVFNVPGNIEAGKVSVSVISPSARGQLGLLADSPYFPNRLKPGCE